MNNIYEFIGIHLSYYTYMVFTYMRNQEFDHTNPLQTAMIANFLLISLFLFFKKGDLLLVQSLQIYIYFLAAAFRPYGIQPASLLIYLVSTNHYLISFNFLLAFLVAGVNSLEQALIFLSLVAIQVTYILSQRKLLQQVTQQQEELEFIDRFMVELPFPLFLVNAKSHVFWSNQLAGLLLTESRIDITKSGLKGLFQEPDALLRCLNQQEDSIVIQLDTIMLSKHMQQLDMQAEPAPSGAGNSPSAHLNQDPLGKTYKSTLNFLTLRSLQVNELIQREILCLYIKPIILNQMKLFMICINTNKSFQQNNILQNVLIQNFKKDAASILANLQQDYIKWDNMRNIEIIKESDLRVLSASIVDLYRIIFKFETYHVSTRFFPKQPSDFFQFKQLIIYLIEIYSGRYLNRFDHITLYFDNSIQETMKGNSAAFSLVFMSLLELIATYCKPATILKIFCNLDQIILNNTAYQIQIQLLWHLDERLDQIFKSFFNYHLIPNDVDEQVQRCLQVIQRLLQYETKINYKEQVQHQKQSETLSEIQIITHFQVQLCSNSDNIPNCVPQLSLTFCRTASQTNPNDIRWQQKAQPKIAPNNKSISVAANKQFVLPKMPVLQSNLEISKTRRSSVMTPNASTYLQKKHLKKLVQSNLQLLTPRIYEILSQIVKERLVREKGFSEMQFIETEDSHIQTDKVASSGSLDSDSVNKSIYDWEDVNQDLTPQYENPDLVELIKRTSLPQSNLFNSQSTKEQFIFPGFLQMSQKLDSEMNNKRNSPITVDGERFERNQSQQNNNEDQQIMIDRQKQERFNQGVRELQEGNKMIADFSQIPLSSAYVRIITNGLCRNRSVKTLKLINCNLNDTQIIDLLEVALVTNVETIYLQYNQASGKVLQYLLQFLQKNRRNPQFRLKTLFLNSNQIPESAMVQERKTLQNNGIAINL